MVGLIGAPLWLSSYCTSLEKKGAEPAPFPSFRSCSRRPNSGPKSPGWLPLPAQASSLHVLQRVDLVTACPPLDQVVSCGQLPAGAGVERTWNLQLSTVCSPGRHARPLSVQAGAGNEKRRRETCGSEAFVVPLPQALHVAWVSIPKAELAKFDVEQMWSVHPAPPVSSRS